MSAADESVELVKSAVEQAEVALTEAREAMNAAKENEANARHELFRADETFTALQGKVHALESLERERVGLAPAAARLLRERSQFGDGAVLGPLSDFVNASAASALLVERYPARRCTRSSYDREAAETIRRWHATSNPGPCSSFRWTPFVTHRCRVERRARGGCRCSRAGAGVGSCAPRQRASAR